MIMAVAEIVVETEADTTADNYILLKLSCQMGSFFYAFASLDNHQISLHNYQILKV